MKDTFQPLSPKMTVLGAGAWGTALAIHLARRQPICLWGQNPIQMKALQTLRFNPRYLPQAPLPKTIYCTSHLTEAMKDAEDILIAIPSSGLPSLFKKIRSFFTKNTRLLLATKGLYPDTSELLSTWLNTLNVSYSILSGPSFAKEVAQGLPTALLVASKSADCINIWKQRLHQPHFQIYPSQDVTGVALCGAMKNVIAIAVGIAEGLALGKNMTAFLITQGLSEMRALGERLSAQPETFLGPAGIGDLSLTCMSSQSRNQRLGVLIGQGLSSIEAQKQLGLLSEGVLNTQAICELARHNNLTLSLCQIVYTILFDKLSPQEAISYFMNNRVSRVEK